MRSSIKQYIDETIRREVAVSLRTLIDDPDFGLELAPKAKKRLGRALHLKQKTVPFAEIKKRYY